jgi:hypothetical protein
MLLMVKGFDGQEELRSTDHEQRFTSAGSVSLLELSGDTIMGFLGCRRCL